MAFSLTWPQILSRQKTVTRRLGWIFARPGDRVQTVRKNQGRRPGEPIERGPVIEFTEVCVERLDAITPADVVREGFPGLTPEGFVAMMHETTGALPSKLVTRIRFQYVEENR